MKVQLIDYTGKGHADPARHAANLLVFTKQTRLNMDAGLFSKLEQTGWDEIEQELKYMANTIASSWEFINYSFLINDVTRAFTHQFVRTRTGSYAQQTMRVLNKRGWTYEVGPSIEGNQEREPKYRETMEGIAAAYDLLIELGAKIEDARGVLPTNIHTNIVAQFNLRTLADTARKRASSRTQGEYRQVLDAMLAEVRRVHPWTTLFLDRTFDRAAADLEAAIIDAISDEALRTDMIKLIDIMRTTA